MKKVMLSIVAIGFFGGGYLLGNNQNITKETIAKAEEKDSVATVQKISRDKLNESETAGRIFETKNVKIEYWEVKNGDYDIFITPKNGTNISPEFSLLDTKNYKEGYIVGTTKENQHKRWQYWQGTKYAWDWSWNE